MNTSRKIEGERQSLPVLFIIIFRTILFLAISLVTLTVFYFVGNFQNFLDSTQHLIILLIGVFSILLLFFSISGLIVSVFFIAAGKNRHNIFRFILTLIFYPLGAVISIVLLLFFGIINMVSLGI